MDDYYIRKDKNKAKKKEKEDIHNKEKKFSKDIIN